MIKDSFVESAYFARKARESAPGTTPRLSRGSAYTVTVLVSLGLWWGIWAAVSSLVFN
jgi:hypothetical protein